MEITVKASEEDGSMQHNTHPQHISGQIIPKENSIENI